MKYKSTRNNTNIISFKQAVLNGLANDGGLYIPTHIPLIDFNTSNQSNASLPEISFNLCRLYMGDDVSNDSLHDVINESFKPFIHLNHTPVIRLHDHLHILGMSTTLCNLLIN